MIPLQAFTEIVDLIASCNPGRIAHFELSAATFERVQALVLKKNEDVLTAEEEAELTYFVFLEKMMGLAKARAHQILQVA